MLILVDTVVWGGAGAERLAIAIATHLPTDRYEAYVCTTRTPWDRTLADALAGSDVHHVDVARSGRFDLLAFRRLIRFLLRERIDILHAHMFGSNVWGTIFGRLCRIPVVIAHEHTWSYVGQPLRRFLDGAVIGRLADQFVAVSNADRERMITLEHVRPSKIKVIPTAYLPRASAGPADVRAELGIGADIPVLGTVAILRPQKALHVLIEAFSLLARDFPTARLVIAGDGVCRPQLEAQVENIRLQDRVHFLGMRGDPDAVWRALDVAAISSDFEGFPLTVIEAMTNGIPLVATAVGGVPELVEDELSGLLVPRRDPAALARALARLLEDESLRARLAEEGERVAHAYSVQRLLKDTEEMYGALLARARRGRRRRSRSGTSGRP